LPQQRDTSSVSQIALLRRLDGTQAGLSITIRQPDRLKSGAAMATATRLVP
jgi:hypothetical protein